MGATVVGHYALFAGGGWPQGAPTKRVDVYDAQTGKWSTASLQVARWNLSATTVGTKALFAGGGEAGNVASYVVDIYDASVGAPDNTAAWSVTTISEARSGMAAASVGGKALFAGGVRHALAFDLVDVYDDATGTWSKAQLSEARWMSADSAVTVGTRAYFAGGQRNSSGFMSDVIDVYDAQTGLWSTDALSEARTGLAAAALGNTVLFAGGALDGFVRSDVVDVLNVGTDKWAPTALLSEARFNLAAAAVGGRALFAGGRSPTGISAVVDVYEPTGLNYCAAKPNSTGAAATIGALGSSSLAANDLVLRAEHLPDKPFLFLHGKTQIQAPFGDGFLCTGGGVKRLGPVGVATGGLAQTSVDLPSAGITTPGVRNFQCWFRDLPAGGKGANTSDALAITFVL
jgi:kelch-like protein 20